MRLACIQPRAFDLEQAEEGLAHALHMTEQALPHRPDLILLPECTYPAYFLKGYRQVTLRPVAEVLEAFARLARRGKCFIALGLVEEVPDSPALRNSAVLLSVTGEVVARGHKHFLWHFDRRWFRPGSEPALADTPWGKVGMFVCADGRLPEIPRLLALRGAGLQLDLTGWVSTGRDPARLTNPQAEYMLRTRALENHCYLAAANKVGMEAGRVVYCGRSQIVSPTGTVLVEASPERPQVIWADLLLPHRPQLERHPAAYRLLARAPEELPVPPASPPGPYRLGAIQLEKGDSLPNFLDGLAYEGVAAAVSSPVEVASPPPRHLPLQVIGLRRGRETGALVQAPGFQREVWAHLSLEDRILDTPTGRLGVMLGREGLQPEIARVLALQGTDWIAWPCHLPSPILEPVSRTRAAENKVYLVAANTPGPESGISLVVDPDGRILAQAFPEPNQAVAAQVHFVLARDKTIVPGTDALGDRQPHLYAALTV